MNLISDTSGTPGCPLQSTYSRQSVLPEGDAFAAIFKKDVDSMAADTLASLDKQQEENRRHNNQSFGRFSDNRQKDDQAIGAGTSNGCQSEEKMTGNQAFNSDNSDQRFSQSNQNSNRTPNSGRSEQHDLNHRNHTIIQDMPLAAQTTVNPGHAPKSPIELMVSEEFKKLARVLQQKKVGAGRKQRVMLSLDLKDMGEVKLYVTIEENSISLKAEVPNRRTAALLTASVTELKEQLSQHGLHLKELDIGVGRRNNNHASKTHHAVLLA